MGKEGSDSRHFNANCHIRSFRFGCQSAQCVLRTLIGNIVSDLFWVLYKIATDITGNNQNRFSPQKVRSFDLLLYNAKRFLPGLLAVRNEIVLPQTPYPYAGNLQAHIIGHSFHGQDIFFRGLRVQIAGFTQNRLHAIIARFFACSNIHRTSVFSEKRTN